jgi:hypothetical protein
MPGWRRRSGRMPHCWRLATTKRLKLIKRASALWGELVAVHREGDVTEEMVSSLATEAVMASQLREAVEEQCRRLAQELTLLSIRGSKMCITVTSSPL